MSDEDVTPTRLRIGGWVPPHEEALTPTPRPPRLPGFGGLTFDADEDLASRTGGTHRISPSHRRTILVGVTALTMAVLLGVAATYQGSSAPRTSGTPVGAAAPDRPLDWPPTPVGGELTPPAPASSALSQSSDASGQPSQPGAPGQPSGGQSGANPSGSGTVAGTATAITTQPAAPPPATPTPVANTTPAGPPLTLGATIGLEPSSRAGYRVRHRNFAGRIDAIGAGSSTLDRADSSFKVRAGLAGSGCFSLESVNYPGHYLRHRDFRIYLHRVDGSALFNADATFCHVNGRTGQQTMLRSYNYPGRYLQHRGSDLYITPADGSETTTTAMLFAVKPPW